MEPTALLIKNLPEWKGDARLYKLSVPLVGYDSSEDDPADSYEYVVVSAVNAFDSGPETYIFGCDNMGNVHSYLDLPGSFRGELNHEKALRQAGYKVDVTNN